MVSLSCSAPKLYLLHLGYTYIYSINILMDILYPPISCLHNKLTLVLGQPLERIPCGPFISKAPVPHETHLSPDHPCPPPPRKYPTYATCNHPVSPLGLRSGLLIGRVHYYFGDLGTSFVDFCQPNQHSKEPNKKQIWLFRNWYSLVLLILMDRWTLESTFRAFWSFSSSLNTKEYHFRIMRWKDGEMRLDKYLQFSHKSILYDNDKLK